MSSPAVHGLAALVRRLDVAVESADCKGVCDGVKQALEDVVATGQPLCPDDRLPCHPDHYNRVLLHSDPKGRYVVVGMVWDVGQGTPLHDHAGVWCVECVYRRTIRVVSYDLASEPRGDLFAFDQVGDILAGVGEAGALIPPFEYHTIENAAQDPAITVHVYGGPMNWCHAFLPDGNGAYRRERRELSFAN